MLMIAVIVLVALLAGGFLLALWNREDTSL